MKASLISRVGAYLIDILLVSLVASLIASFLPQSKNLEKLYKEEDAIIEQYSKGEIDMDVYVNQSLDLSYDLSKQTVLISVVQIFVAILYFCVFQFYQDGQTIGKKILGIKIKKQGRSKLTMNDLLIRSFIIDSIFTNILSVALVLFVTKNIYIWTSSILSGLQYGIILISFFMVAFSKNKMGLHDLLVKTVVVKAKEKEEVEDAKCES